MRKIRANDIKIDRLKEISHKINSNLSDIISRYQSYLDKSESKEEDYVIIDFAMEKIMQRMCDDRRFTEDEYEAIFMDSEAMMMPMPEGVVCQLANILFDAKHLDILQGCFMNSFTLEPSSFYEDVEEGIEVAREGHAKHFNDFKSKKNVKTKDSDTDEEESSKKVCATCESTRRRGCFEHTVRLYVNDRVFVGKNIYVNRTWEKYDFQNALIEAVKEYNDVFRVFSKKEIEDLYRLDSFKEVIEELKKRV